MEKEAERKTWEKLSQTTVEDMSQWNGNKSVKEAAVSEEEWLESEKIMEDNWLEFVTVSRHKEILKFIPTHSCGYHFELPGDLTHC